MAKRKRISFGKGTIFLVPLKNGECGVGQVLTDEVMGLPTVGIFQLCVKCNVTLAEIPSLVRDDCLSVLTIFGYPLKTGEWPVVGIRDPKLNSGSGDNWKYRANQWIGSKHYSDGIIVALLNAYLGLEAWDDFADPEFLDKLLLPPHTRPEKAWLIKSN